MDLWAMQILSRKHGDTLFAPTYRHSRWVAMPNIFVSSWPDAHSPISILLFFGSVLLLAVERGISPGAHGAVSNDACSARLFS